MAHRELNLAAKPLKTHLSDIICEIGKKYILKDGVVIELTGKYMQSENQFIGAVVSNPQAKLAPHPGSVWDKHGGYFSGYAGAPHPWHILSEFSEEVQAPPVAVDAAVALIAVDIQWPLKVGNKYHTADGYTAVILQTSIKDTKIYHHGHKLTKTAKLPKIWNSNGLCVGNITIMWPEGDKGSNSNLVKQLVQEEVKIFTHISMFPLWVAGVPLVYRAKANGGTWKPLPTFLSYHMSVEGAKGMVAGQGWSILEFKKA